MGQPIRQDLFFLGRFSDTREDGTFRVGPVKKGRRYCVSALVDPPRAEGTADGEPGGGRLVIELKPHP